MKNNLIKIGVTVIVLIIGFLAYKYFNQPGGSDSDGTITFILINQNDEEVIHEELSYKMLKADGTRTTLFDIINDNYDIACATASYDLDETCSYSHQIGKIILAIEEVETDFFNSYLEIHHKPDGEAEFKYSNKGVILIEFKDGDKFMFKFKDMR